MIRGELVVEVDVDVCFLLFSEAKMILGEEGNV